MSRSTVSLIQYHSHFGCFCCFVNRETTDWIGQFYLAAFTFAYAYIFHTFFDIVYDGYVYIYVSLHPFLESWGRKSKKNNRQDGNGTFLEIHRYIHLISYVFISQFVLQISGVKSIKHIYRELSLWQSFSLER